MQQQFQGLTKTEIPSLQLRVGQQQQLKQQQGKPTKLSSDRATQALVFARTINNFKQTGDYTIFKQHIIDKLNSLSYEQQRSSSEFLTQMATIVNKRIKKRTLWEGDHRIVAHFYHLHDHLLVEIPHFSDDFNQTLQQCKSLYPDVKKIMMIVHLSSFVFQQQEQQQTEPQKEKKGFFMPVLTSIVTNISQRVSSSTSCGHMFIYVINLENHMVTPIDSLGNTTAFCLTKKRQPYHNKLLKALKQTYDHTFLRETCKCLGHQRSTTQNCVVFSYIYGLFFLLGGSIQTLQREFR